MRPFAAPLAAIALALLPMAATAAPLDLNTASQAQLDALPGIGPVLAGKIVAGRPYKSKDELIRRKIIPPSAYAAIKDKVVAQHR